MGNPIRERLARSVLETIPPPAPDPVDWAEAHVRLPNSARSDRFDKSVSPWILEPLSRVADLDTRVVTFVKPVQSGGSTVGEVAMLYWICWGRGFLQYNWENDKKAELRWESRIEPNLEACDQVPWPADRFKRNKCRVSFPTCFLRVQGVWVPENLDSDTVRYQINEEIHNWEPGHLQKAYNRTTALWDYLILNISNAGKKGDQLHQAYEEGTRQEWEVRCPGCGRHHVMRTRWEDKKPKLGGLRYNADGCRREDGTYNYNKLAPTIRYQMPCGYVVRDTAAERRELSMAGRYSSPRNTGAHVSQRSYTLEAVAVDYIPWLKLVQEKHQALRARRYGDPEPWRRYVCERECGFYDPEDLPILGRIVLSDRTKDRAGLKDRVVRFAALDRQQGELAKGELPHWWMVIRDVADNGDSLLVYEGKVLTDEDVVETLARHEVTPRHVVVDSGHDATHVYQFCLRHGYNAIKGSGEAFFSHPESGRRIYSVEKPLHHMLNLPPTKADPLDEPQFWFYSKSGIRERLVFLRDAKEIQWEVPRDVSEDYQSHMESEERVERRHPRTNEILHEWRQLKTRNDLFVCECYIAMLIEMAGLIGAHLVEVK